MVKQTSERVNIICLQTVLQFAPGRPDHRVRPEPRWVRSVFTPVAAVRRDAHPPEDDIETVEGFPLEGETLASRGGKGESRRLPFAEVGAETAIDTSSFP